MISFGEKLRRQREKLGYSLVTFSSILDISQRTLQRLEKNETEPALSIILKLRNIVSKNDYISFFYDEEEIIGTEIEIIKFSLIGRLSTKTKDSSLKYFQSELLLLHEILSNLIFNSKNDLINQVQNFKLGLLDKLVISQKNKDNVIAFILQLSDEEIEYIIQNKNEFILTMFEFRNLANKLFTLDKKPS